MMLESAIERSFSLFASTLVPVPPAAAIWFVVVTVPPAKLMT
jgi:hypothetical protein